MTKISVESVLFKSMTISNVRVLRNELDGQYDVRLGRNELFANFFSDLPPRDETDLGGWTKSVPVKRFDGAPPVESWDLNLKYMGPSAARTDDYYFPSQATVPYPLWAPGRAFPEAAEPSEIAGDLLLIIKDVDGHYHARWVPKAYEAELPAPLLEAIQQQTNGKIGGTGVFRSKPTDHKPTGKALEILDALNRYHNVLLYGPPATGKTHLIGEVRRQFVEPRLVLDTESERAPLIDGSEAHSAWVTFHQSYSYEDFLVGLRPKPVQLGQFDLCAVPGVLLELTEWARRPGHKSLLVIDEINRGNVSRIFGEFITLIEPDKRLQQDGLLSESTVSLRLPFLLPGGPDLEVDLPNGETAVVPSPFTMPSAVYTLATMNSVDKSVAPLDAALRRRFHVIDLFPDLREWEQLLKVADGDSVEVAKPEKAGAGKILGLRLLRTLNRRISMFLGPDFTFGQWFLSGLMASDGLDDEKKALAIMWRNSLMPQLEEYFASRTEQLLAVLGFAESDIAHGSGSQYGLVIESPSAQMEELGAVVAVRGNNDASDLELIELMMHVVNSAV